VRAFFLFLTISLLPATPNANPYPDPLQVPTEASWQAKKKPNHTLPKKPSRKLSLIEARGSQVLRVQIEWREDESFRISHLNLENSGTSALSQRKNNLKTPKFGSYRAFLKDPVTGVVLDYDSIGTGKEYRKLTRALSFRFPVPTQDVLLVLQAEHPVTGDMEEVLNQVISPSEFTPSLQRNDLQVTLLHRASQEPKLVVSIYAEGYTLSSKENQFLARARAAIDTLETARFPHFENMEFQAVFALSGEALGSASNLGMPVPERDSFLGLYFPYWNAFGRWYHVLYPTRVSRYREAIGQVAYDYALVLVDSSSYWGVGNFKESTTIPANSNYFSYLLLHEIGHYFGLNEEYEEGGRTELEFAPAIPEAWSPNISFLPDSQKLKWNEWVLPGTPIPTPRSYWNSARPRFGAYRGGYAQSPNTRPSHKPGFACIMENHDEFCPICRHGLEEVIGLDLGKN